ncbi:MAG: asparaginase [Thermoplasmatota archaeon]
MHAGVPLATESRSGRIEAVHQGHAVLLAPDGTVAASWGDPELATYWRSSAKPIQVLTFLAAGGPGAIGLPDDEVVALACASHSTQQRHLDLSRRFLAAAGLVEADYGCGGHEPIGPGGVPGPWSAVHNNCSGKHAAMLAACRLRGWPTEGYLDPHHPIQQAILADVARLTGRDAASIEVGVDGCRAPTFWLSPLDLARAFQRLDQEPVGQRVFDAMALWPVLVGGEGRFCTALPRATRGDVVGKVGAMGLYVALHRPTGAALAVKVTSGPRMPVQESVACALAEAAGWLDDDARSALAPFQRQVLMDTRGCPVGELEPSLPGGNHVSGP